MGALGDILDIVVGAGEAVAEFAGGTGGQVVGQIASSIIGSGASKDASQAQVNALLFAGEITQGQALEARRDITENFEAARAQTAGLRLSDEAADRFLLDQTFKGLQQQDIAREQSLAALAGGFGGAREDIAGGFAQSQQALQRAQAQARGDITAGSQQAQQALEQGRAAGVAPLTGFADPGRQAFQRQAALTGALGPEAQQQALESFRNIEGTFAQETEERAILRNAAATGGLAGGNVLEELGRRAQGRAQQNITQRIAQLQQQSQLGLGAATGISGIEVGTGQNLANIRFGAGQALAGGAERFGFGQSQLSSQQAAAQATLQAQLAQLQSGQEQLTGGAKSALEVRLGEQRAGLAERVAAQQAASLQAQGTALGNIGLFTGQTLSNLAVGRGTVGAAGILGQNAALQSGIQGLAGIGTGTGAAQPPGGVSVTGVPGFSTQAGFEAAKLGFGLGGVPGALLGFGIGGFTGGGEQEQPDFSGGFEFGGAFGGQDELAGLGL